LRAPPAAKAAVMTDSSPISTPNKRKLTELMIEDSPSPVSVAFCFDVNGPTSVPASGSSSPRTKVAHRFRGLALTDHGHGPATGPAAQAHGSGFGGGGVASTAVSAHAQHDNDIAKPAQPFDREMHVDENESIMRKRTRISSSPESSAAPLRSAQEVQAFPEVPETPDVRQSQPPTAVNLTSQAPQSASNASDEFPKTGAIGQLALDQAIFSSSPKSSPSKVLKQVLSAPSNRPVEAVKSKVRKRAGTPPLVSSNKVKVSNTGQPGDAATEIIDPIRAALTWHEDEITVYDPEDEDDDGVGINGIGFKPTPAIAYARTVKRRQQLAEYKKREEREARARRNLRRRGSAERPMPILESKDTAARKVRFTETEPSMMIETI
ncbi:hypothetical protein N0V82_007728, partial [Gnomoniopsis sp. IMI 355080]